MENITVKKVVINYNKELLDSIDNKCQKKHKILDTIVTIAAIPIILYLGYYILYYIYNKNVPTKMFTYIVVLIIAVSLIIFDSIDNLLDVPKRNNKLYRINKILYHVSLNKINEASFRKIDGKWYCNSADIQDTISFFYDIYCEYPIYVALEDILNYGLNDFTDKIEIPDQWDSLSISVNEKTQKIDVLFT